MVRLWRLCRNRYGRAAYEALGRAGVTATVMYEYVREFDEDRPSATTAGADGVGVCAPGDVAPLDPPIDELLADEAVVGAFADGVPVGYLFLSLDARHDIHPLERTLAFDGAYVRRVYVDPDHRNEGIATALVSTACARARAQRAERATALVALDNVPSRSLFAGQGFEPRRSRWYVRIGPLSHSSTESV